MKSNAQKWLEQFGLNVISTRTEDDSALEGRVTAESFLAFVKGREKNSEFTFGDFRFVCLVANRSTHFQCVAFTVYPKDTPEKLGWLTLRKSHASNFVEFTISNCE